MKIDITPANKQEPELTYPVLMEALNTGNLVLFTAPTSGCALRHVSGIHTGQSWIEATNKTTWKPFIGTITLSN